MLHTGTQSPEWNDENRKNLNLLGEGNIDLSGYWSIQGRFLYPRLYNVELWGGDRGGCSF
jgi:hypothetical protein